MKVLNEQKTVLRGLVVASTTTDDSNKNESTSDNLSSNESISDSKIVNGKEVRDNSLSSRLIDDDDKPSITKVESITSNLNNDTKPTPKEEVLNLREKLSDICDGLGSMLSGDGDGAQSPIEKDNEKDEHADVKKNSNSDNDRVSVERLAVDVAETKFEMEEDLDDFERAPEDSCYSELLESPFGDFIRYPQVAAFGPSSFALIERNVSTEIGFEASPKKKDKKNEIHDDASSSTESPDLNQIRELIASRLQLDINSFPPSDFDPSKPYNKKVEKKSVPKTSNAETPSKKSEPSNKSDKKVSKVSKTVSKTSKNERSAKSKKKKKGGLSNPFKSGKSIMEDDITLKSKNKQKISKKKSITVDVIDDDDECSDIPDLEPCTSDEEEEENLASELPKSVESRKEVKDSRNPSMKEESEVLNTIDSKHIPIVEIDDEDTTVVAENQNQDQIDIDEGPFSNNKQEDIPETDSESIDGNKEKNDISSSTTPDCNVTTAFMVGDDIELSPNDTNVDFETETVISEVSDDVSTTKKKLTSGFGTVVTKEELPDYDDLLEVEDEDVDYVMDELTSILCTVSECKLLKELQRKQRRAERALAYTHAHAVGLVELVVPDVEFNVDVNDIHPLEDSSFSSRNKSNDKKEDVDDNTETNNDKLRSLLLSQEINDEDESQKQNFEEVLSVTLSENKEKTDEKQLELVDDNDNDDDDTNGKNDSNNLAEVNDENDLESESNIVSIDDDDSIENVCCEEPVSDDIIIEENDPNVAGKCEMDIVSIGDNLDDDGDSIEKSESSVDKDEVINVSVVDNLDDDDDCIEKNTKNDDDDDDVSVSEKSKNNKEEEIIDTPNKEIVDAISNNSKDIITESEYKMVDEAEEPVVNAKITEEMNDRGDGDNVVLSSDDKQMNSDIKLDIIDDTSISTETEKEPSNIIENEGLSIGNKSPEDLQAKLSTEPVTPVKTESYDESDPLTLLMSGSKTNGVDSSSSTTPVDNNAIMTTIVEMRNSFLEMLEQQKKINELQFTRIRELEENDKEKSLKIYELEKRVLELENEKRL
eukprot:TRINITY_DN991_c5_g1_i1.p1 TRINITY_DN991_c5_g1~~TRINITY_DN991_c5_g1_i1.p1  ORF type:complete len:1108 (+),score=504.67 TRINITY_DN991_c5_g1_i1:184-3324(+)